MSIGAVPSSSAYSPNPASGGAEDKIRQLEQRLEQLGKEKAKAEKAHDTEKADKLQKQMEELQRRIQLLKQREESKRKDKTGDGESPGGCQ